MAKKKARYPTSEEDTALFFLQGLASGEEVSGNLEIGYSFSREDGCHASLTHRPDGDWFASWGHCDPSDEHGSFEERESRIFDNLQNAMVWIAGSLSAFSNIETTASDRIRNLEARLLSANNLIAFLYEAVFVHANEPPSKKWQENVISKIHVDDLKSLSSKGVRLQKDS